MENITITTDSIPYLKFSFNDNVCRGQRAGDVSVHDNVSVGEKAAEHVQDVLRNNGALQYSTRYSVVV